MDALRRYKIQGVIWARAGQAATLMCGIVATVGVDPAVAASRGAAALTAIAHRGPDDEGTWTDGCAWLGHRRLSIIDLTAGGHQPMVHEPSGLVITYNGEIYNYIELGHELEAAGHSFRTQSDTEVLLVAYLNWGESCLDRLNGMWSFLIWDPRNQIAFFARDRLGVKPLYFSIASGGLSIASEPKALIALNPDLRRVDEASLYAFLAEGQLYTGKGSFYAGIQMLEPGHCATYDPAALSLVDRKYWAPPASVSTSGDYAAAVASFGDLLGDAVRLRMRSDVPVGFTLSGGLDSSAVLQAAVSATASTGGRLNAFTSVYEAPTALEAGDEREWASLVATKYERVALDNVPASGADWHAVLEKIVWHMDGPGYSPAVFPLWRIMEHARAAGVPVLLEGQGADELLGGYTQYAAVALWDSLSRHRPLAFLRDFRSYARTFSVRMLTMWLARERAGFAMRAYRRRVGALGTLDPDFVSHFGGGSLPKAAKTVNGRLEADLTRDILPGLLHYGDAISMAHSVESRLPFLDYRLVEFVSSLPADFKLGGGETKRILRDHLRSVELPAIANRRDKQGYPTPANTWLSGEGGAALKDLLLSPDAQIQAYCRPKELERLIDYHAAGHAGAGNHLYRLLTTELWLRTCIAGRQK
jgi:asparagine synthase (glutamine-hydrolysing)